MAESTVQRRADDSRITELVKTVNDHIVETRKYRCENSKEIRTMNETFITFTTTYGPMLEEALQRRGWWAERVEKAKITLVDSGIKVTFLGVLGLILAGLWVKFQNAVLAAIGLAK
jgi:hypothetical protein